MAPHDLVWRVYDRIDPWTGGNKNINIHTTRKNMCKNMKDTTWKEKYWSMDNRKIGIKEEILTKKMDKEVTDIWT